MFTIEDEITMKLCILGGNRAQTEGDMGDKQINLWRSLKGVNNLKEHVMTDTSVTVHPFEDQKRHQRLLV